MIQLPPDLLRDPFLFQEALWPQYQFYDKQVEIVESVCVQRNKITVVPAANMMGKDFIAGFLSLRNYLSYPVARIVTTSVKDDHLRVLWGEINRFLQSSRIPLTTDKGGLLKVMHRDIRKVLNGEECPISYLRGMVSEKGEGLAGHHAPYTFAVIDEASGVDDLVFTQMDTWAQQFLIFGNCNPCPPTHFFHRMVERGDVIAEIS